MDLRKVWAFGKSTSYFYLRKRLTCIRPSLSVPLPLFSLRLENFERRGLILTGVRGSYRKQAGPSLNNPMRHLLIHRSDRVVCRERPASLCSSLSLFLSFSSRRAVVTAKRFNLTLAVSLWRYWLSDLTPRNRVANECSEVNYSRFETYVFLFLSVLEEIGWAIRNHNRDHID